MVGLFGAGWGWWIGPGRAGYVDDAVGDGDGPVAVVEVGVVAAAEEGEVVDRGDAAADPGLQVVGVALDGRGSAHDTALVAGVQGAAHSGGDEALGAADVEGFGVGAEDEGDDLASQAMRRMVAAERPSL